MPVTHGVASSSLVRTARSNPKGLLLFLLKFGILVFGHPDTGIQDTGFWLPAAHESWLLDKTIAIDCMSMAIAFYNLRGDLIP